jgi:hypothetical protein
MVTIRDATGAVVKQMPEAGAPAETGDAWGDTALSQRTPQGSGIARLVAVQLGWTLPRTSWSSPRADDRRYCIDEGGQLGRAVAIGGGTPDGEGDAMAIDDHVVLGPRLAAVDRIRTRLLAPCLARTLSESTLARDQSMVTWSPSQFKSRSRNFSDTPLPAHRAVCLWAVVGVRVLPRRTIMRR